MSDLIDRQQALEIKFSNAIVRRCAVYVRMDELVNKLNALPSVQPERTKERTEMHACDLISRQAAIDGKISIQLANGVEIYSDEAVPVEYLKNLPTIQPVATDTNVGDTISRRDAINALNEYFARIGKLKKRGLTKGEKAISLDTVGAIKTLPSAQPEPHEGHWIRTDCGLDVECKCSRCGYKDFVSPHDTYWFKRNYCPNCGAKMTISK